MTSTVPDILARIVAVKRSNPAPSRSTCQMWERKAEQAGTERRDFSRALSSGAPAIISEIKRASPSKGLLCHDFQPARIAGQYAAGGAAALSVLTDQPFFQGSLADLQGARSACFLPVLRKDFTLGETDVLEAAAHGADAILLIAAILETEEMVRLQKLAGSYGMAVLVEVHNESELDKAIHAGAMIIGVNNRDLSTFVVTLETSLHLAERIPSGVIRVSESGIHSAQDIRRLRDAGFQAFLVGEHLMKSGDPAEALRALVES